jgi:hypothetical protein
MRVLIPPTRHINYQVHFFLQLPINSEASLTFILVDMRENFVGAGFAELRTERWIGRGTPDRPDFGWEFRVDPDVNDFNVIREILRPYDANLMRRYPVSRKLNNSRIDDAEAASPVTLDAPTQERLF